MTSSAAWLDAYLARLGVSDPGEPSPDALAALHRAHVERIAYENIDIQLGRPQGIDPDESIRRILAGRGGYCFNLNGALSALLAALGFRVTRHRGAVHGPESTPHPDQYGNHMAVTVDLDGETWMVDAGLGTAHHEPMRLTEGEHRQGPYTFRLERITPQGAAAARSAAPAGQFWRFVQDPALSTGSFLAMDFSPAPAHWTDFLTHHAELSTSPTSSFLKTAQVLRRDATGADALVDCVLRRIEGTESRIERELATVGEWFEAAHDVFGLNLSGIRADEREWLWRRIRAAYETRLAARAAKDESSAPAATSP